MKESDYQASVIDKIMQMLPDAIVLKNDANYRQGIPDWSVFCGCRWAWLEIKQSADAKHRPNQDYYVDWGKARGFGAFVYPENEAFVLQELFDYFN